MDTDDTRKMWKGNKLVNYHIIMLSSADSHRFETTYTVTVKSDCLVTDFSVSNRNSKFFCNDLLYTIDNHGSGYLGMARCFGVHRTLLSQMK